RRAQKRAGRMRKVMLAEYNAGPRHSKPFLDEVLDPELVSKPTDHGFTEHARGPRKALHARQHKPLEFDERFLEERNVIQVLRANAGSFQAEVNGVLRESIVVLYAREALLFGGRN